MSDLIVKKVNRDMAWQRAKGELNSILVTYYDNERNEHRNVKQKFNDFIELIENETCIG